MIKFIRALMEHKRAIFKYGKMLDVHWWQLAIHDLDKFLPMRFLGYWIGDLPDDHFLFSYFNKDFLKGLSENARFNHKRTNPHHLEYWMRYNVDGKKVECVDIPDKYLREMAADWLAARVTQYYDLPKSLDDWPLAKQVLQESFISEKNRQRLRSYLNRFMSQEVVNNDSTLVQQETEV